MKIEAEVEHSVYAFHHSVAEAGSGGGECSASGAEPSSIAQERSSIDRPEWQPPGCGGCGPPTSSTTTSPAPESTTTSSTGDPARNDNNNNNAVVLAATVVTTTTAAATASVFDCEHFQFIDEEEEEEEEVGSGISNGPATVSRAPAGGQEEESSTPRDSSSGPLLPTRDAAEVSTTQRHQPQHQRQKRPQQQQEQQREQQKQQQREMGESESAVKRQVIFDDTAAVQRELRSLLKRPFNRGKRPRNRVTFDEAVTLYSDENEEVQILALTTGPDIVYQEVFYMFEPPIEYQDVPPFEPPAEYRDCEDNGANGGTCIPPPLPPVPVAAAATTTTTVAATQPLESVVAEAAAQQNTERAAARQDEIESASDEPPPPLPPCREASPSGVPSEGEPQPVVPTPPILSDYPSDLSDVAVSRETENSDCATEPLRTTTNPETGQRQAVIESSSTTSSSESDQLFERFLEAEREFAVDEELNSVFHALESDFSGDEKNGALDDNFFRKLISLLSSAEGDGTTQDGAILDASDYFPDPSFSRSQGDFAEDDDSSQAHSSSRTLSEADSDCSISSQDTIIVRFSEDDNEQTSSEASASALFNAKSEDVPEEDGNSCVSSPLPPANAAKRESFVDEVFTELSDNASSSDERPPRPLPRESLLVKGNHVVAQAVAKLEKANGGGESLSRQSSGEQSVNSGNSQDPPQDADDSTSSDSRSGEVEEEIRLDDIGYDEEDAEDYDEESFRGMAHGNSKIRRIIKKNALQCTLFRGIEAKRRQQPGVKYPRPKSPLLSQESLVEKLKWLTTIDEHKDADCSHKFHSKPPDVILSTGGVPVNGSMPHSASSEDDLTAQGFPQPPFYQMPQRHGQQPPNAKAGYYVRRDGFPPTHHPSLPRQRVTFSGHPQQMMHTLPYTQNRVVTHPQTSQQMQWSDQQRSMSSMTVPRNFRDWRVIQRITGNRSSENSARSSQVPADYVRCPNGSIAAYPVSAPPDVSRTSQTLPVNKDELEQFVEKDSRRMDMIRKRYSVAEEEDDPTFGFARRPSVRGVQSRIQSNPSENIHGHGTNKVDPYALFEEQHAQGPALVHSRSAYPNEQVRIWSRDPNWRPDNMAQSQIYGPQGGRSQVPMHIHRASVALTELPGNATIPYTHRKPHPDTRYHSYAESMYGSTRTLPTKGWLPPDPRCHVPNPVAVHQNLPLPNIPLSAVSPPMLQVPPHSVTAKDERGVPEGASSSPKISSDSLYHAPVPDAIATGGPHKEDGMIYYSLNV